MRFFLNIIFFLTVINVFAQHYESSDLVMYNLEKYSCLNSKFHSNIKPYYSKDVKEFYSSDSLINPLKSQKLFTRKLYNQNTINYQKPKFDISLNPLFAAITGYDNISKKGVNFFNYGVSLKGQYLNNLYFTVNILHNNADFPNYFKSKIDTNNIIPGQRIAKVYNNRYNFFENTFSLAYMPSKYFILEAGNGKNFIGDGHRTLFLSDNSCNYPYFKIITEIWKVKYLLLWTNFKNINEIEGTQWGDYTDKYGAFHCLSFNISKRLNFSFFEGIIWQSEDSLHRRGFDINYLNPIIFYRPVEFSLGSPDNAILGGSFKFKLRKRNLIYAQLLLDEFRMTEVRNGMKHYIDPVKYPDNWGAWLNKQAFQFGLKSFDIFDINGLGIQLEYNYVRPYVYSHKFPLQNYSNFNQPLAQPHGANFEEIISILKYSHKKLYLEAYFSLTKIGYDSIGTHVGQDIFKSSYDAAVKGSNNVVLPYYGHSVGDGLKTNISFLRLKGSYLINPKNNLRIEGGLIIRNESPKVLTENSTFVFLGIRTSLVRNYDDY